MWPGWFVQHNWYWWIDRVAWLVAMGKWVLPGLLLKTTIFGDVERRCEVICILKLRWGCGMGDCKWGGLLSGIHEQIVHALAYMWNCIGCSFDYMRKLIKCSLLIHVISFGYKFTRGNLFGYTYKWGGGDVHGNGGFIAMFVVSRFASGAKYLVYCRVFTVM